MITHVVTRWGYGSAFNYDLSILNWWKMYGSACGNGYDNALDYGLPFFIKFDNVFATHSNIIGMAFVRGKGISTNI